MESNIVGGSSNSSADVAQYYYATDLRPGTASSTPRGWDDLVKLAGTGAEDDKAKWQHMATYVIGMGVSGTLKFDKDYKNGAGDFTDLRTGAKSWPNLASEQWNVQLRTSLSPSTTSGTPP